MTAVFVWYDYYRKGKERKMSRPHISEETKELFGWYKEAFGLIRKMLGGDLSSEIISNLKDHVSFLLEDKKVDELKLMVLRTYIDKVIEKVTDEIDDDHDREDLLASLYPIFDSLESAIESGAHVKITRIF